MNYLKDKIYDMWNKLYHLSRATWGLNSERVKDIYKIVFEKTVTYACPVWYRKNSIDYTETIQYITLI